MPSDAIAELNRLKNDKSLQIELDGKPHWVVEGDLLVSEAELLSYARRRVAAQQDSFELKSGLVADTDDEGHIIRWAPGLSLTYAVLKQTFPNPAHYSIAVQAIHSAANDWESICGVKFEHLSALDEGGFSDADRPLFVVERQPPQGNYLAFAFFPAWSKEKRRVLLLDTMFKPGGFSPAAVLRHELGHVLGFRHEHIHKDAPAGCFNENTDNTTWLTDYDPQSVMHYLCGGVGDPKLEFTDADRAGARALYGPPHHEVQYYT